MAVLRSRQMSARLSRFWPAGAVVALVLLQAALLFRIFAPGEPCGDDNSIHLAEIAAIVRALRAGDLNLWNASANLGFPSGYYYQIAPQLLVAMASLLCGGAVPLVVLFK